MTESPIHPLLPLRLLGGEKGGPTVSLSTSDAPVVDSSTTPVPILSRHRRQFGVESALQPLDSIKPAIGIHRSIPLSRPGLGVKDVLLGNDNCRTPSYG